MWEEEKYMYLVRVLAEGSSFDYPGNYREYNWWQECIAQCGFQCAFNGY